MPDSILSIKGIHTSAGPFSAGADFDLFKPETKHKHPDRVSIVFGRNGSGKSTISGQATDISVGDDTEGWFYGGSGNKLLLDPAERHRIRVFNEDYVSKKILIEENGLDAIVMLGDQALAKTRIDELDQSLVDLGEKAVEYAQTKEEYESGTSSLTKLEKAAKESAKKGGWAQRAGMVEGRNPNLTQQRWTSIARAASEKTRQDLQNEFDERLASFRKADSSGTLISIRLRLIDTSEYDEKGLLELLSRELDKPELSDREKRILSIVQQQGGQAIVEHARTVFAEEKTAHCPMCQQEVTGQYKASLEESIRKVLSKEADEYKAALKDSLLTRVAEEDNIPEQVSDKCRMEYITALATVNGLVNEYNSLVENRMANLYTQLQPESLGLADAITGLNSAVSAINAEINQVNEAVKKKGELRTQLLALNDQIAHVDAADQIKTYGDAVRAHEDVEKNLQETRAKIRRLQAERDTEEAKMRQTQIAAKLINRYLASVYFDASRFTLVATGDRYAIRSHGLPVKPAEISTGERNILGLCYFFSEACEGKLEGSEDDEAQYVILDDPVSSFDMENRVGICSLIRERAAHILSGNVESRITVLTHDGSVVAELQHTFDDVNDSLKGTQAQFTVDYLELCDGMIQNHSMKKTEYSALLRRAYQFAKSDTEDEAESYVIGNILRRILEGYATFNYGIGMAELSRDKELVKRFGPMEVMLTSVMYRLALNDESHMQERLSALNPAISFDRYGYDEKKALAQCTLVILGRLDADHVSKILATNDSEALEIEKSLRKWEKRFTPKNP